MTVDARLTIAHAAMLGAVQGLTEFLPVSSSAHLALARRALRYEGLPRAFDVTLHLGTAAALLLELRGGLAAPGSIAGQAGGRHGDDLPKHAVRLALANLPAVVAGGVFYRSLERRNRHPGVAPASLAAGALAMLLVERRRGTRRQLSDTDALLIGAAQAVALVPGVSRSGATITAGLARGLDREAALRFSFLLAAPISLAAAVRSLPDAARLRSEVPLPALAVGAGTSFVAGLAGIRLLRGAVARYGLWPFAVYRLALAGALWWQLTRSRPD